MRISLKIVMMTKKDLITIIDSNIALKIKTETTIIKTTAIKITETVIESLILSLTQLLKVKVS